MIVKEEIDLIEALQSMYPQSKRNTLRKMLTQGRVLVDGEITYLSLIHI